MNQPADVQAELNLRTRHARCTVCADAVNELCGLLRGRGWVTARELIRLRPNWTERFIRSLAHKSNEGLPKGELRVVSGPGTPGYGLSDEVEIEEILHAGFAGASQGMHMLKHGHRLIRFARRRQAGRALLNAGSDCLSATGLRPTQN